VTTASTAVDAVPIDVRHLVGGSWLGGSGEERENPARPGEVVSVAPAADPDLVDEAVSRACAAFPQWAATPAPERGEILRRAADLLEARSEQIARTLSREEGKTLREARDELGRGVRMLRFYAGETWHLGGVTLPSATPRTQLSTTREPLGAVGIITPWNFPVAIPVWKSAPALAAGNTVVLKPASLTAASTTAVAECLVEAGLPAGVLNVVHGAGGRVGEAIVTDERIAAISFTGSTAVGRRVNALAARRMARVQLELGGKNTMVVLPDADPDQAADLCVRGAFGLTGQACTATSRVLVLPGNEEAVLDALRRRTAALVVGDGLDENTQMGPVVSQQQLATDLTYLEQALAEGAALEVGGDHSDLFLSPTLLSGVGAESTIAQEEVFGPVLAVITVRDADEALAVANNTQYGLVTGVVTNDLAAAMEFSRGLQAGVVKVNRLTTGTDLNAPFGGMKASSNDLFREQGVTAMEFYTRVKTVYLGY
jgi:aldehyde dehydrogenase (NAD+)